MVGAKAVTLASGLFTLAWTHSVEGTEWREDWRVAPGGLVLVEARVKGSGAGMEPGEGARLEQGWWVWRPGLPPLPELALARSGATTAPWRLCADGACAALPEGAGAALRLAPCGDGAQPREAIPSTSSLTLGSGAK